MKKYIIRVYIPVESEDITIYDNKKLVEKEKKELEFLQPENLYFVEEVDMDSGDLEFSKN